MTLPVVAPAVEFGITHFGYAFGEDQSVEETATVYGALRSRLEGVSGHQLCVTTWGDGT
ncbi:hypothetical protein FsymDg_2869 [Candidatus Protofrankia datiscae]|uniref:Uncharacterized protein n=1 Tax=Candidatus Protofrankia datiscae TaxID=2716812 RepID=F8B634_9ACTN|nr:hypothetical protein [Candidatus Protofrankia datiscae]AEH10198.1 hypothetical protein FsymDg_2869 [Candidatus Protofrankia datiscae]